MANTLNDQQIILSYRIVSNDDSRSQKIYNELEQIAQKLGGIHDATTSTYLFHRASLIALKLSILAIFKPHGVQFRYKDYFRIFVATPTNGYTVYSLEKNLLANHWVMVWKKYSFTSYMRSVSIRNRINI